MEVRWTILSVATSVITVGDQRVRKMEGWPAFKIGNTGRQIYRLCCPLIENDLIESIPRQTARTPGQQRRAQALDWHILSCCAVHMVQAAGKKTFHYPCMTRIGSGRPAKAHSPPPCPPLLISSSARWEPSDRGNAAIILTIELWYGILQSSSCITPQRKVGLQKQNCAG